MMDSEEIDYDVEIGQGPENQGTTCQKWARPDLPPIDPNKDAVIFQQIDIDHYTGVPMNNMPGAQVSCNYLFICYNLLILNILTI